MPGLARCGPCECQTATELPCTRTCLHHRLLPAPAHFTFPLVRPGSRASARHEECLDLCVYNSFFLSQLEPLPLLSLYFAEFIMKLIMGHGTPCNNYTKNQEYLKLSTCHYIFIKKLHSLQYLHYVTHNKDKDVY